METYTLAELTERAGRALDALGVRVGNRRVRQRPDARTVRYYTQHGLVDRPLAVGGREARYGRRHLAQVVAVKRLQAAGVALADIQRRLAGAADSEVLAAIGPGAEAALGATDHRGGVATADRPEGGGAPAGSADPAPGGVAPLVGTDRSEGVGAPASAGEPAPGGAAPRAGADRSEGVGAPVRAGESAPVGRRSRAAVAPAAAAAGGFWRAHPAGEQPAAVAPQASGRARTTVVVPLAGGVEVSIEVDAGVDVADVDTDLLQSAARPLLDQLHRLGLPAYREEGTSA